MSKAISVLQNNVALFAQLYIIAMQSRDADLEEFFSNEGQPFPLSLPEFGNFRLPSAKTYFLKCIIQPGQPEPSTGFDCRIWWCCRCSQLARDQSDYIRILCWECISCSCAEPQQQAGQHCLIYLPESLKESTQQKKGKRVRRKVSGATKIPPKLMQLLRDSANKELFVFLKTIIAEYPWPERREIYITSGIY